MRQGSAEGRTLQDAAGRPYGVALVSRRSRLHPGMRYIARGLNALASPGNEAEVEQLMWTQPSGVIRQTRAHFALCFLHLVFAAASARCDYVLEVQAGPLVRLVLFCLSYMCEG